MSTVAHETWMPSAQRAPAAAHPNVPSDLCSEYWRLFYRYFTSSSRDARVDQHRDCCCLFISQGTSEMSQQRHHLCPHAGTRDCGRLEAQHGRMRSRLPDGKLTSKCCLSATTFKQGPAAQRHSIAPSRRWQVRRPFCHLLLHVIYLVNEIYSSSA